jgi:two-component sensor histidine kinase
MSLTEGEELPLTPERPSQRSLDPRQPTAEEQAALAEQQARGRAPQPVPPQQGPGVAFARLGPTNPAQVASLQPQIPQTPQPGVPEERPEQEGQGKKLAGLGTDTAQPDETPAPSPIIPDYNINPPAIYKPPLPNREPGQWKDDDWFAEAAQTYPGQSGGPNMPSTQEAYPNAADSSRRLAHLSDGPLAEQHMRANLLMNPLAAIADAFSKGQFSRNFSEAYLRGIRIQQEEAVTQLFIANEAQKKFNAGLGEIIEMSRGPNPLLNEQQAKDAIRNYLIENHHQSWLPFLDSHNIAGIARLAQIQDAERRRQQASGITLKKSLNIDGEDAMLRSMGINPGGTAAGTTGLPGDVPGQAAPEADSGPPLKGELAPFNHLSASQKSMAYELLNHRVPNEVQMLTHAKGERARQALADVFEFTRALEARAHRIAAYQDPKADPAELSQRKLEALRQMNPEFAHTIEGLKNLEIDPKGDQIKNRRQVVNMVGQVFPGWNEGMYHRYQNIWANENGKIGQQIQAANRVGTTANNLYAAINNLPFAEDAPLPVTLMTEILQGTYGNNPRYNEVNEYIGAFVRESITTQTGRPGGTVSAVNQMMKKIDPRQGKAGLRAAVRASVSGTRNLVEGFKESYTKDTGLPAETMPGYLPKTQELYDGIVSGNPWTGTFDKDAPVELREVSPQSLDPEGKFRKNRPKWMDKNMEYEPMSKKEFNRREQYIRDNPNDPLTQLYLHELGIRR